MPALNTARAACARMERLIHVHNDLADGVKHAIPSHAAERCMDDIDTHVEEVGDRLRRAHAILLQEMALADAIESGDSDHDGNPTPYARYRNAA